MALARKYLIYELLALISVLLVLVHVYSKKDIAVVLDIDDALFKSWVTSIQESKKAM